jgi:phosphotransferase system enzyme I (PtsI)
MSFSIFGLAVSQGIAIGRAQVIANAAMEVAQYQLRERDVVGEVARLDAAFSAVLAEFEALRVDAPCARCSRRAGSVSRSAHHDPG